MKQIKKSLLKKRFEILEKERRSRLKKLSLRTALKLEEELLSSRFVFLWRKNFSPDTPVCLRDVLRKGK